MNWTVAVAAALLVVMLLYWLLITTEGTYLGSRVVAMLYDWVAHRYDAIKRFDPQFEHLFVTRPALTALSGRSTPLVLDVATGTGRVPTLLLGAPAFDGRLVALDYSRLMLQEAARKVIPHGDRVALVWRDAMALPFSDRAFDLVTCLEALEFMPRPQHVLTELIRVIRPGGMLLVSHRRGWQSRLMPGKSWSERQFRDILSTLGLVQVQLVAWQADYNLAWGWKPASGPEGSGAVSDPAEGDWLESLLRCPTCGARGLRRGDRTLRCVACQCEYQVAADGIIDMS